LNRELPVYTSLAEALKIFRPTVAFITNPTALHVLTALECARAGCHLLVEKPVSHNLDGLAGLQEELDRRGVVAMVAYMLRFHPLLRQVKTWLDEGPQGTLGRPVHARVSWGEHVPDWHPWEDYRDSYSTRPELGGGPALTLSHELDTLVWLFGRVQRIVGLAGFTSPLEVKCEHSVDMLLEFAAGPVANVHLDYFQRPPQRSWELVCSRGRVVFDYFAGTLTRFDGVIGKVPTGGVPEQFRQLNVSVPSGFDRNDMFIAELEYFFKCLASGSKPAPGLAEAGESVRIARAVLDSNLN
jgi:predicted dehydrogenase